jgi:hypothetical protein
MYVVMAVYSSGNIRVHQVDLRDYAAHIVSHRTQNNSKPRCNVFNARYIVQHVTLPVATCSISRGIHMGVTAVPNCRQENLCLPVMYTTRSTILEDSSTFLNIF